MAKTKDTHGSRIVAQMRRRALTYMEMLDLCISTCPWRRVTEYLHSQPGFALVKTKKTWRGQELTAWKVIKAK